MKPRWKRCVESTDRSLGEALGKEVRREVFPAGSQGADAGDGAESPAGHARRHPRPSLDERRDQRESAWLRSPPSIPRSAIPTSGRTTASVDIRRDAYFENVIAGSRFAVEDDRSHHRQARRPRALGHDAAHLGRLLQPAAQRDRLPRGHPAAAGFRHQRGRRGELRRDRRRDRARDLARLRRRGRAVRLPRAACATGGPRPT